MADIYYSINCDKRYYAGNWGTHSHPGSGWITWCKFITMLVLRIVSAVLFRLDVRLFFGDFVFFLRCQLDGCGWFLCVEDLNFNFISQRVVLLLYKLLWNCSVVLMFIFGRQCDWRFDDFLKRYLVWVVNGSFC